MIWLWVQRNKWRVTHLSPNPFSLNFFILSSFCQRETKTHSPSAPHPPESFSLWHASFLYILATPISLSLCLSVSRARSFSPSLSPCLYVSLLLFFFICLSHCISCMSVSLNRSFVPSYFLCYCLVNLTTLLFLFLIPSLLSVILALSLSPFMHLSLFFSLSLPVSPPLSVFLPFILFTAA